MARTLHSMEAQRLSRARAALTVARSPADATIAELENERELLVEGGTAAQSTDSAEGVPLWEELCERIREVDARLKALDPSWVPRHMR